MHLFRSGRRHLYKSNQNIFATHSLISPAMELPIQVLGIVQCTMASDPLNVLNLARDSSGSIPTSAIGLWIPVAMVKVKTHSCWKHNRNLQICFMTLQYWEANGRITLQEQNSAKSCEHWLASEISSFPGPKVAEKTAKFYAAISKLTRHKT